MGAVIESYLRELDVIDFREKRISVLPLSDKQKAAMEALCNDHTEELGYGGAAGGGKSWLGCYWLIMACLAYPGTKWFVGRAELKRLILSTYVTFRKVGRFLGLQINDDYRYNGQLNYIEFPNGSRIDFLDLKYLPGDAEYERFGSLEYTGGWIEEGGEIDAGAYEVLSSRVGRHMNDEYGLLGKLLVTLNPKRNWVYRLFYKPWFEDKLSDHRAFVQAFVADNPYGEANYASKLDRLTGTKRRRLRDGDWEYDNEEDSLMAAAKIEDIFHNDHIPKGRDKYLTADIAMHGSDIFVVGVWFGLRLVEIHTMRKSGGKQVLDLIQSLRIKHQISPSNVTYDADGVGSFLGGEGGFIPGAKPFNGGSQAKKVKGLKENYKNLRSQCYFRLSQMVNAGQIWVSAVLAEDEKDKFRADLSVVKHYNPDSERPMQVWPKSEMKKRLGRSPDYGDMLMMRMVFLLRKSKKMRIA